jgi:two-component system LytT family sensor kinase
VVVKDYKKSIQKIAQVIIICSFLGLIFTLISYGSRADAGWDIGFGVLAALNFVRFFLWGAVSPVIFVLTRRFGFEIKQYFFRNLTIQSIFGILFSILHSSIYGVVYWLVDPTLYDRYPTFVPYLRSSFFSGLYIGLIIYAVIVVSAQAYYSNLHVAAEEKKALSLKTELVQAQLHALKMQLQPHFLFNTLNSISSLVLTDPSQAYTMIAQLGDFLRLTLEYSEDQMVFLHEELRFLRSYLEIEQTRFSDRLAIIFDIEDEVLGAVVPHLVLQPVVENSIKHGIAKRKEAGTIEIRAKRSGDMLCLYINDNGPGISLNEENRCGTGISNIRSRLAHLYGKSFTFDLTAENGGGTKVVLVLPLDFRIGLSNAIG